MSQIEGLYGAQGTALTCTITSLGNGSLRQSTAIDNTANLFINALVQVTIKTNAAGTSGTGYVAVYAYGSADSGTSYTDSISGTDGAYTAPASTPNIRQIGLINCTANATTYVSQPFSIEQAFGGVMPEKWGIVVENQTGAALDAAIGTSKYTGRKYQSV